MIVVREDNLASLCELKVGDILAQNYNTRAVVIQADNKIVQRIQELLK